MTTLEMSNVYILKSALNKNSKVLKSLSETRWSAHCADTVSLNESHSEISACLQDITKGEIENKLIYIKALTIRESFNSL